MIDYTTEDCLNNSYRRILIDFKANHGNCQSINYGDEKSVSAISFIHGGINPMPQLLFVQGRAETIDKYLTLFHDLYNAGYDIYSYDHPGQGYSGCREHLGLSWIDSFEDYERALTAVIKHYELNNPVIIGVSMGGLVAVSALNKQKIKTSKMILVTPMFKVDRKGLPKWLAILACDFFDLFGKLTGNKYSSPPGQKSYRRPAFTNNNKTHSERRLNFYHDWYSNSQIFPIGGVTWHWLSLAYRSEPQYIRGRQTRIMLIEAQNDTIVDNSNNEKIIKNSTAQIEIRRIRGAYHDLLNEEDDIRNQTLKQITEFIQK
jgi:lysophospholipase